jgi:hypothetical protein
MITSVITTINYPTEAVKKIASITDLIIVSDEKTPKDWFHKTSRFIGTGCKKEFAPYNHYARKNLGYLAAIANGSQVIYDTDDDNMPNENWKQRTVEVEAIESAGSGWYNVYNIFTQSNIWPRGLSLNHVKNLPLIGSSRKPFTSSIQQGLSDGEPDVDAIYRFVNNNKNTFSVNESVYLKPGAWCPFNSQSTWWFPKAYPLMYLPVTASFRMTDIWRSFVAQRCLWEMGEGVTFHSPAEVYQDRNEHDLLKDFEDEIPGYLLNDKIVKILQELKLNGDVFENMKDCYLELIDNNIMPLKEINSLNAWIRDLQKIYANS